MLDCVLVFCTVCYFSATTASPISTTCTENTLLKQYQKECETQYPGDPMCQLRCTMKSARLVDGDGDLRQNSLPLYFPNLTNTQESAIFKECYPIKAVSCAKAAKLKQCLEDSYHISEQSDRRVNLWTALYEQPIEWKPRKISIFKKLIINKTTMEGTTADTIESLKEEALENTNKYEIENRTEITTGHETEDTMEDTTDYLLEDTTAEDFEDESTEENTKDESTDGESIENETMEYVSTEHNSMEADLTEYDSSEYESTEEKSTEYVPNKDESTEDESTEDGSTEYESTEHSSTENGPDEDKLTEDELVDDFAEDISTEDESTEDKHNKYEFTKDESAENDFMEYNSKENESMESEYTEGESKHYELTGDESEKDESKEEFTINTPAVIFTTKSTTTKGNEEKKYKELYCVSIASILENYFHKIDSEQIDEEAFKKIMTWALELLNAVIDDDSDKGAPFQISSPLLAISTILPPSTLQLLNFDPEEIDSKKQAGYDETVPTKIPVVKETAVQTDKLTTLTTAISRTTTPTRKINEKLAQPAVTSPKTQQSLLDQLFAPYRAI